MSIIFLLFFIILLSNGINFSLSTSSHCQCCSFFHQCLWRLFSAFSKVLIYEILFLHLHISCCSTSKCCSGHLVSPIISLTVVPNTVSFGAVIWWCNTDIQCLSQRMHNFTFHRLPTMEQKLSLFFG